MILRAYLLWAFIAVTAGETEAGLALIVTPG